MSENLKVIWTKESKNNVNEIIKYLDTNWPPKVKKQFLSKLKTFEKIVTDFPYSFPVSN